MMSGASALSRERTVGSQNTQSPAASSVASGPTSRTQLMQPAPGMTGGSTAAGQARKAHAKIEERRDDQAAEQRRKEERKDHDPARASLSDPEARIMKMGDGSYRPAYNVQIKTTADGAHVIGVSVTDRGADYGLLRRPCGQAASHLARDPAAPMT